MSPDAKFFSKMHIWQAMFCYPQSFMLTISPAYQLHAPHTLVPLTQRTQEDYADYTVVVILTFTSLPHYRKLWYLHL